MQSQRIVNDQYVLFLVDVPGYAAQNFAAENVEYQAEITLPPNTVGYAVMPNPVGWNIEYDEDDFDFEEDITFS